MYSVARYEKLLCPRQTFLKTLPMFPGNLYSSATSISKVGKAYLFDDNS